MPRRIASAPKSGTVSKRAKKREWKVTRVAVEARQLVTIEPDDPAWTDGEWGGKVESGALVKLKPPADAPDDVIATARQRLESTATRVKVDPRQPSERVATDAAEEAGGEDIRGHRQVVMDRFERSKNITDEARVREILTSALDAAGL